MTLRIAATAPDSLWKGESTISCIASTIGGAKKTVDLLVPYIDEHGADTLFLSLDECLKRGIGVRLLVRNGRGVSDVNVRGLTRLAVRLGLKRAARNLQLFQIADLDQGPHNVPSGLHAKVIVADSARGYVGSANMTRNGLANNIELGLVVDGPEAGQLVAFIDQLIKTRLAQPLAWDALAGKPLTDRDLRSPRQ